MLEPITIRQLCLLFKGEVAKETRATPTLIHSWQKNVFPSKPSPENLETMERIANRHGFILEVSDGE